MSIVTQDHILVALHLVTLLREETVPLFLWLYTTLLPKALLEPLGLLADDKIQMKIKLYGSDLLSIEACNAQPSH